MNHAEMQFLTTEFPYKKQYANFIGGEWVKPVGGEYFDNISPITGEPFTSIPRSREADIELALDAAHRAKTAWGKTSTTDRANILNRIADRICNVWPSPRRSTTASRCAKPWRRIFR
jgi:aldehyde dehydrogenase